MVFLAKASHPNSGWIVLPQHTAHDYDHESCVDEARKAMDESLGIKMGEVTHLHTKGTDRSVQWRYLASSYSGSLRSGSFLLNNVESLPFDAILTKDLISRILPTHLRVLRDALGQLAKDPIFSEVVLSLWDHLLDCIETSWGRLHVCNTARPAGGK